MNPIAIVLRRENLSCAGAGAAAAAAGAAWTGMTTQWWGAGEVGVLR